MYCTLRKLSRAWTMFTSACVNKSWILTWSYSLYNQHIWITVQWCTRTKCCSSPIHLPSESWYKHQLCFKQLAYSLFFCWSLSYSSLSLFTSFCASLHSPFALYSAGSFLPSPLSFGRFVPCGDCLWHDLCNGFTALSALRGITGIPASLRVDVFVPVPSVVGVSIYHSLAVCLPWQLEALCVMSGTPPHQQLYTASKPFWCAVSHSFILGRLKSRSAQLLINYLLFSSLRLTELQLLQCRTWF